MLTLGTYIKSTLIGHWTTVRAINIPSFRETNFTYQQLAHVQAVINKQHLRSLWDGTLTLMFFSET